MGAVVKLFASVRADGVFTSYILEECGKMVLLIYPLFLHPTTYLGQKLFFNL